MSVEEEKPTLAELDEEGLCEYLKDLSKFDYAKKKKGIAKELGFSLKDLDQFREKESSNDLQGSIIEMYEPEQWDDPVNGADILTEASDTILRHMVMRRVDADACALWAMHTHIFELFSHTDRLLLTAPDAECAKTLLMVHLVGDMCTRPMAFELMKPAPFFRLAELSKPTFLIDEADQFLHSDAEVLAAVNAGWEPHGKVPRCGGDDQEVRGFSTHCPVALAGVEMHKHLKNTTISRSIVIHLERAGYDELLDVITYDKEKHRTQILDIGRKFARWCWDNRREIRFHRPELPAGIINRAADKWAPMLSLADIAGGDWPNRARAALMNQPEIGEPNSTIQLLIAMREIIGDEKGIWTQDLIPALVGIEAGPWADYNFKQYDQERKWITDKQIARLLSRYGVEHGGLRIGESVLKGYTREAIQTAHDRYVPKLPVTPTQEHIEESRPIPKLPDTPTQNDKKAVCNGVTDDLPLVAPASLQPQHVITGIDLVDDDSAYEGKQ